MSLFNIHELLNLIFSYIDDRDTLDAASRVCKTWFTVAYPYLWSSVTYQGIRTLESLEPSRRRLFLDCVRCLNVSLLEQQREPLSDYKNFAKSWVGKRPPVPVERGPVDPCIVDWESLKLKSIRGIEVRSYAEESLSCFLSPTIRSIVLHTRVTSKAVPWATLDEICPNLEQLALTSGWQGLEAEKVRDLYEFIVRCPSLIDLEVGIARFALGSAVRRTLQHGRLQRLCLIGSENNSALWDRWSRTAQPIWDVLPPSLLHLNAVIKDETFLTRLSTTGVNLKTLCLQFASNPLGMMSHIGLCESLTTLTMCFLHKYSVEFNFESIKCLRSLTSLEHFALVAMEDPFPYDVTPEASTLNDDEFLSLVQCFPRLRFFCFLLSSGITTQSLVHLSKSCRQLRRVMFQGCFDLESLVQRESGCLFPVLEQLWLGRAYPVSDSDIDEEFDFVWDAHASFVVLDTNYEFENPSSAALALRNHAPNLSTLMIGQDERSIRLKAGTVGKDNRDLFTQNRVRNGGRERWSKTLEFWAFEMVYEIWNFTNGFHG